MQRQRNDWSIFSAVANEGAGSGARWHVSAAVDIAAYALSWVWALIPLAMLGDAKADYLGLFIIIMVATDLHRHFGLPYVYLDRQVRTRFQFRFAIVPVLMVIAWLASPWLARHGPRLTGPALLGLLAWTVVVVQLLRKDFDGASPPWRALGLRVAPLAAVAMAGWLVDPVFDRGWIWLCTALVASIVADRVWAGRTAAKPVARWILAALLFGALVIGDRPISIRPATFFNALAVVAGAWNIWHVLMQKYGILRLYNAKSGNACKVPGWVDRLLLFGWVPLFLVWLGPSSRREVLEAYPRGRATLLPLLDVMEAVQPVLLLPALTLVVASFALFLRAEYRANRLANAPRLWLAGGTTVLSAAFFFVHPLKVYLAYAFSHAVEYMVFVWAFQRRRYAKPLPHRPPLARILKRPWLAYGGFIVVGATLVVMLKYYGRTWLPERDQAYFVGISTAEWFLYWGLFQSMVHFYFDGFLWKMRSASTRAHI